MLPEHGRSVAWDLQLKPQTLCPVLAGFLLEAGLFWCRLASSGMLMSLGGGFAELTEVFK